MTEKTQARLRLATSDGAVLSPHLDLCNESSAKAAAPRGSAVRFCSMSLTAPGDSPMSAPISARVSPVDRKSEIRDAHVVMGPSIRNSEVLCQRKADTAVRNNAFMPRPKDLPPNLLTVGQRVRWWRKHRRLDQGAFAKAVGIAQSTLSDLENDRQSGSGKLHLIAAKLGLNAHYLELGKGEPEAEFAQEAPPEAPEWPFEDVSPSRLSKLNMIERKYAEMKLQEALADIESERRKSKKTG